MRLLESFCARQARVLAKFEALVARGHAPAPLRVAAPAEASDTEEEGPLETGRLDELNVRVEEHRRGGAAQCSEC